MTTTDDIKLRIDAITGTGLVEMADDAVSRLLELASESENDLEMCYRILDSAYQELAVHSWSVMNGTKPHGYIFNEPVRFENKEVEELIKPFLTFSVIGYNGRISRVAPIKEAVGSVEVDEEVDKEVDRVIDEIFEEVTDLREKIEISHKVSYVTYGVALLHIFLMMYSYFGLKGGSLEVNWVYFQGILTICLGVGILSKVYRRTLAKQIAEIIFDNFELED